MNEKEILTFFMSILSQIKLFHWATMSFAKHTALDKLHTQLSDKIDKLVEAFIGSYDKQPLPKFSINIKITSDITHITKYLKDTNVNIKKINNKFKKYAEIQNILQDIMADIDVAIYLSKLK
jgi:DNA-binding ferritin-like protein